MKKWNVDASHSSIGFSVKHMMVSKVRGSFSDFTAEVAATETDLSNAEIAFNIQVASITTGSVDRDNHLRSADFFDVETYPEIKFIAKNITKKDDEYEIAGDLTIKAVTNPVVFNAEYEGKGTNPWGQEVVGFSAETKINREEFGLTWNQALETGGVLVGKDIKITIELEANPA
ncbi:YceI family protein [Paenisporosarcina antarctica]|uniref:Polyisoprenoid-binding protein n=1 Tax=Paenisporosarcina antarctica TaxID=417367 RepID=A0A4P6ZUX3_9BACL|nr:YceI family protein [Paenisporosarcina antarctica]QBP39993.1 polyisoprenoid-binding protein [Paenisporosarcina antarctica]